MKFVQNEPIPIRNMKEIHEIVKSATLIGFLDRLVFPMNFNHTVNPLT